MLGGASHDEIALVLLLVLVVVIAPKVGAIGEAVGALFEKRGKSGPPPAA